MDNGRVALVSGAGRGIGRELALGLARDGWSLGLLGRTATTLEAAAQEVREAGAPAVAVAVADVADHATVEAAASELERTLGAPSLLVNNAGLIEADEVPIWESDPQEWRSVVEVNLFGVYHLVRAVVPRMLGADTGGPPRVVTVSTGSATRAAAVYSAYHASKTGASRITGALHEAGVLAFDVAPGVVVTDMTQGMAMHEDRTEWTDPAAVVELVRVIAWGELDEWSGRHLRAGSDEVSTLRARGRAGLTAGQRTLSLAPYGDDDPLLG